MKSSDLKPYGFRMTRNIFLLAVIAYAASYLGRPPPKTEIEKVQISLELRKDPNYHEGNFGYVEIYKNGEKIPLCHVLSTTAVRNFFTRDGSYAERTRIQGEVCQLPPNTRDLEALVVIPYEPADKVTEHNLDNLDKFAPGILKNNKNNSSANVWYTRGKAAMNTSERNISITIHEKTDMPNDNPDKHYRNADRWDIKLMRN